MTLTPEDVISKTFLPTRFTEGYKMDEVDDFLDEVVASLESLNSEIEELREKLAASESAVGRLTAGGVVRSGVPTGETSDQPASDRAADQAIDASGDETTGDRTAGQPAADQPGSVSPADPESTASPASAVSPAVPEGVAGVLALAQRLHDEHVRNGQARRDALIAEAQARAAALVAQAEQTRDATLSELSKEQEKLESSLAELRGHEREYRVRMQSFFQAQLTDLQTQQTLEPEPAKV